MSPQPYGMTTPEQRDQAADDDESARHSAEALNDPARTPPPGSDAEERSVAGRNDGDGQAAAQPAAQAAEDLAAQLPGGGR